MMSFSINNYNNKDIKIESFIKNKNDISFISDVYINDIIFKSIQGDRKIKNLNEDYIIIELEQNPYIETSNVFLTLDGTTVINVIQKVPMARIKTKNQEFYIDSLGNSFPLSNSFSYPCILINGNIESDEYKKLAELCNVIKIDSLLKNHIVSIEKNKQNSYNLILNQDDFYIEFGNLDKKRQKLENIKEFYKQYLDYNGFDLYKKISLKFDGQIVATKK